MTEQVLQQRGETMQEVIDLLNHYAWSFDADRMDQLEQLFSHDAITGGNVAGSDVTWGPWQGPELIGQKLGEVRKSHPHWRRHQLTTPYFSKVSATQATVQVYLSLFSCVDGKTPEVEVTGEYRAGVSKGDGLWKIDSLQTVLDSTF
jgi:hypothetical protein